MQTDEDDVVQFAIAAAAVCNHDPERVREWAHGDLLHFATYIINNQ
jgi:hypothetical protein